MTIAITGATGQLGRLVVSQLLAAQPASELVALVRTPAKAQDLGIAARAADYTQAETLAAALAGVETLLLISSSEIGQRRAQHRNVIAAAAQAGVRRIVYTSLLHADRSPLDLAVEHLDTEAALKASGIAFTILRNGWYTENYTSAIAGALAGGAYIGSAGAGRISSAARADYAAAAVAVLTSGGHDNKTYELAGDAAYTLADLAAEISRQTGRSIPYVDMSVADYAKALTGFGLPEGFAQVIAGWGVGIAAGALFDEGRALSRLIGRTTTPMAESVSQALVTPPTHG
ncbi:SDR family oxidoreductase [Burkholderiaceae bacterium UC74_6]